ncbi:hypothetical protein Y695_01859 [Hydrogenophaga sp. T4]|nr:hypothetical protein Y695_01859 [Hydrogenophaga sp. T4]
MRTCAIWRPSKALIMPRRYSISRPYSRYSALERTVALRACTTRTWRRAQASRSVLSLEICIRATSCSLGAKSRNSCDTTTWGGRTMARVL